MSSLHEPVKSSLSWRELWPFVLPLPFALALLVPKLLLVLVVLLTILLLLAALLKVFLISLVGPRQLILRYASLQINFPRTYLRIVLALSLFLLLFSIQKAKQAKQAESDARQDTFLNIRFISVQPKDGRVVMIPGRHGWPRRWGPSTHEPITLSIGSVLQYYERHSHGRYTVTAIEDDGVIIRYKVTGGFRTTLFDTNSGQIKLGWK